MITASEIVKYTVYQEGYYFGLYSFSDIYTLIFASDVVLYPSHVNIVLLRHICEDMPEVENGC